MKRYRLIAYTEERCYHRHYGKGYHIFISGSDGWILSDTYARKGHPVYRSDYIKRYILEMASHATRTK